jgi:LacI family transcriptional regulator
MSEQKYITIKDIARECGVSHTTVSLALRDHERISLATKKRVREMAERLGYRRHPMLSALMANLSQSHPSTAAVPLAALYTHTESAVDGNDYHRVVWQGMQERAGELGFKLDRFFFDQKKMTAKRVSQILVTRGIRGVVIPAFLWAGGHLSIDWDEFCVISVGYSMLRPNMHRVCPDQYRAIRMALRELRHLGYTRPGLVLNEQSDVRTLNLWRSGFYGLEYGGKRRGVVPVLETEAINETLLLQWYKKYKPDVIISSDLEIVGPLQKSGLDFPKDIGLISLDLRDNGKAIAGINQNGKLVGAAAIEQLVQLLYYNESGIPEFPRVLQIPSIWRDGESVVKQVEG